MLIFASLNASHTRGKGAGLVVEEEGQLKRDLRSDASLCPGLPAVERIYRGAPTGRVASVAPSFQWTLCAARG